MALKLNDFTDSEVKPIKGSVIFDDKNFSDDILLKYRKLNSGLFFMGIWSFIIIGLLFLLKSKNYNLSNIEGLTLVILLILSLLNLIDTVLKYNGKYLFFKEDYFLIHYSILNNVKIYYVDIEKVTIKNEIAYIEIKKESTPNSNIKEKLFTVPLMHLSFKDQKTFIDIIKFKLHI